MKPAPFEYLAPTAFDEAVELMAKHGHDARPLAGGQSLVAVMNTRLLQPAVIIDLGHCANIDGISETDGGITLQAMARQASAEFSPLVAEHCPLLAAALPHVGARAHRNRGTVCGSLAHADPLAELPCVAVALDAEFTLAGHGKRRKVSAHEFFQGALSTALDGSELLEAVTFPKAASGVRAAFVEVGRNRRHGFAVVGVAAQVELDGAGTCQSANIAVMGIGDVPTRMSALEASLKGREISMAVVKELVRDCAAGVEARSDIHASSEYRQAMVGALIKEALAACNGKVGAGHD